MSLPSNFVWCRQMEANLMNEVILSHLNVIYLVVYMSFKTVLVEKDSEAVASTIFSERSIQITSVYGRCSVMASMIEPQFLSRHS